MSKFDVNFAQFWAPFWSLLGRLLGAKLAPKSDQKSTKNRPAAPDRPKTAQEHPKSAPREPKRHPKSAPERPKGTQKHPKGTQESEESKCERCRRSWACFGQLIRCSRPRACFVELIRRFPFSASQVWDQLGPTKAPKRPKMTAKTEPKSTPRRSKIDVKIVIKNDAKTKRARPVLTRRHWAGTPPQGPPGRRPRDPGEAAQAPWDL